MNPSLPWLRKHELKMSNHIWQLYTGNFVPGMQFARSQRQKKMPYFPSTDSRCLPTLLVSFVLGFCVSFKATILATQCHGYIVPTLMWSLRLQWCGTALSTLPSYVRCMLRCGPLRSRAGTPHSTFFALPFAMCIIFLHLSIQGCWILCDGPPSSFWSPPGLNCKL